MKFAKFFAFAVMAGLILASCANLEKNLYRKGGEWNQTSARVVTYVDGTQDSDTTYTDLGTIKFNEDGTGTTTANDSAMTTSSFTWTADNDAETITITQDSVSTTMDVLEEGKNEMTLYSEMSFDILGTTIKTETTSELERIDD